ATGSERHPVVAVQDGVRADVGSRRIAYSRRAVQVWTTARAASVGFEELVERPPGEIVVAHVERAAARAALRVTRQSARIGGRMTIGACDGVSGMRVENVALDVAERLPPRLCEHFPRRRWVALAHRQPTLVAQKRVRETSGAVVPTRSRRGHAHRERTAEDG